MLCSLNSLAQHYHHHDHFPTLNHHHHHHYHQQVSIGNHEYDHLAGGANDPSGAPGNGFRPFSSNYYNDSNGECAVPIYHRFQWPNKGALGAAQFYYSFDAGPLHVVQLSSEHDYTVNSTQWRWLLADLLAVNRSRTPFVVATAHRMMYTTQLRETGDYFVSQLMQAALDDLFNGVVTPAAYVNLMLVGHQHSYVARGLC